MKTAEGTMFIARVCVSAERNISYLSQNKVWRHSSSQSPVMLNLQEPWWAARAKPRAGLCGRGALAIKSAQRSKSSPAAHVSAFSTRLWRAEKLNQLKFITQPATKAVCLLQGPVLFPHLSFSAAAPRAQNCPGCRCYHLSPSDLPDFKTAHLVTTGVPCSKENIVGYWVTQAFLPSEVLGNPSSQWVVQWKSLSVVRVDVSQHPVILWPVSAIWWEHGGVTSAISRCEQGGVTSALSTAGFSLLELAEQDTWPGEEGEHEEQKWLKSRSS